MSAQESPTRSDQIRHFSENLMAQAARGREWATPGVYSAAQKAVLGLDSGIESASPRIQAAVRRLAEELAGGVETVTPRIHERLQRVAPTAAPDPFVPRRVEPGRRGARRAWLIAGAVAVAVSVGVAAWRVIRTSDDAPVPPAGVERPAAGNPDDDPANAGARI